MSADDTGRGVGRSGVAGRLALAAAGGALLTFAYPAWNIEVVVWFALAPLLAALWSLPPRKRGRRGFALGYLFGFVFFVINIGWLRHAGTDFIDPPWLSFGLPLGLAAYLALYPALWGAAAATFGRPRFDFESPSLFSNAGWNLAAALFNASAWAGLEWLRGIAFTGFGWNGLGVALWQNATLSQAADVVGVTGLSFLVVFVTSASLGLAWRMVREFRGRLLRPHADFAAVVVLVLATFAYGLARLTAKPGPTVPLKVLVVQLNIPQEEKWDPDLAAEIYRKYYHFTEPWVENQQYHLVVWPESALPYQLDDPESRMFLDAVLALGDFPLAFGANEDAYGEGVYNTLAMVKGDALGRAVYRKVHLVPFGEYVPLRGRWSPFEWAAGRLIMWDFDAGTSTEPMPIPGHEAEIIPAICFEDTIGRLMRKFVRPGRPQVIVNVTNDGWFKRSAAAEQHLANATFRCIELRRPMIRAANTGVSGIIDHTGSLFDRTANDRYERKIADANGNTFTEGVLSSIIDVPTNPPTTLYARAGEWFAVTTGIAALASALTTTLIRHRKNR